MFQISCQSIKPALCRHQGEISLHCTKNGPKKNQLILIVRRCCHHLTMGTTGPEFMYLTRSLKNGFALKAA